MPHGALVTPTQMAGLRLVAELGMQTDVTILRQTTVDSVYGDDEQGAFVAIGTVKGWLRSMPAGMIDIVSGVAGDIAEFRLFVPYGTDIANGDRTDIGGKRFVVQDTTAESTYQVVLRCTLRREE